MGGGGQGGGSACFDYASFNGASPVVSFKADVLPIFRGSCGLSNACHGNPNGPLSQPYLGPPLNAGQASQADIDAVLANIVNVEASKEPLMKRVAPSAPEVSFLMHKMDGTLTCPTLKCSSGAGCGGSMPLGGPTLPQQTRDVVRRWIDQGAKND
jgi:hypothetical protein